MDTLNKCIAEFELLTSITYDENIPIHVSIVEDMAKFKDNQVDNLGLNSISLNGISESYQTNYPETILNVLARLKKKVVLF